MTRLTYCVFLISGVSGLMYQIIWVREFGQVFGNTVQSASLVTGTFVLGLGVGSYLAGRIIDTKNSRYPKAGLAFYAYAELLIGAFGLLVSLVTPRLEALSPAISTYVQTGHGWYELTATSYLLRYLVAVALLGPITLLMGATLTFLVRFLLAQSIERAGWKIGMLYGMNTLGAAIGCALVDLWAVPAFGLMHTKMIAVALNAIAGLSALYLLKASRIARAETAKGPHDATVAAKAERKDGTGRARAPASVAPVGPSNLVSLNRAGLAIAISGFCALGMEIVWFRFLTSVYSESRYVFSLLLVTILAGMWLGSLLAGHLSRRLTRPSSLYIFSQLLFAVSLLLCLFAFFESDRRLIIELFRNTFFGAHPLPQDSFRFKLYDYAVILWPAFLTMFLPAVFMGFAFPAINVLVQTSTERVGSNAGTIYLWNCCGAVAGAFTTGFVLLPAIGMQNAITVLAMGSVLAILPVLRAAMPMPDKQWFTQLPATITACTALFAVLMTAWLVQPADYVIKNSLFTDWKKMLDITWVKVSEGINEVAMVAEGRQAQGTRSAVWRRLYTNGHPMSGTDYLSVRYMTSFVHIPLLQIERPQSVLVICFGVGNTLHAASLHPTLTSLEVVDLSKNVLGLASYFKAWNKDVLNDPRTRVFVNDGRQHLRMQPRERYDLVTLEPPPLAHAGVASLYSEEFYRLVHRALKKGGYLTQWLPVYQVAEEHNRRLIKAFIEVFPNAVLLNGANKEFILVGQKDGPNEIDWRSFARRLDANDPVKNELRRVDLAQPVEWLGMFAASPTRLSHVLRDVKPMTDDDPVIEDNHFLKHKFVPKEIFDTAELAQWCPSCFSEGRLAEELTPLRHYLRVLQDIYGNADFLRDGPFLPEKTVYKIRFSPTGGTDTIADAQHLLLPPTQEEFKALLSRYSYLTTFGPDWAFQYQP